MSNIRSASEILRDHGISVQSTSFGRHYATCPQCSHKRKPAHQKLECLGVTIDDRSAMWYCNHCDWKGGEFYESRGHSPFVAEYIYKQVDGTAYLKVCKTAAKAFPQFHWDANAWVKGKPKGPKIPYRLPELVAATSGTIVYICEGEKDADNLGALGFVATTVSEGSKAKWDPALTPWFTHGQKIARGLQSIAASVKVVELYPERTDGSDVSDWLKSDTAGVKLIQAVNDTPPWEPSAGKSGSAEDATTFIAELAALSKLEYAKRRKHAAEKLGIRVSELDDLVGGARDSHACESLFPHWMVEPSAESVEAEPLLIEIIERIRSHVAMPTDSALVVALWVVMTWVHDVAAVHSPILLVTSPEPNSGKSTLLGVLSFLARRSLQSVGITAAALYRSIEKWQPTIIVDEADTAFTDNDDLRSVVNSGWTRGQGVIRCDSETNEPRMFSTFCPKAIGMKGRKLPDTTIGRTIIIEMARKRPGECVTDFRYVDDDGLAGLRMKLARFATDNAERLRMAEPDMPLGFENRRAANWRLLLAIADSAKDETTEWGRSARQAAVKMSGIDLGLSPGIQLLADIKKVFETEGDPTGISTKELIALLTNDPESRWCEFGRSRGHITPKGLAGLLGKYNIISKTVRRPLADAKGYLLADFAHAWGRYLDPEAFRPDPSTSPETASQDPLPPPQTCKRPTVDESSTYGIFANVPGGCPDVCKMTLSV